MVLGLHQPQLEFLAIMGKLCCYNFMLYYFYYVGNIIIEVIIEFRDVVILVAWYLTMVYMVDMCIDAVHMVHIDTTIVGNYIIIIS